MFVRELEADGVFEQGGEETFFLFNHGGFEAFGGVAAKAAEKVRGATLEANEFDAGVAHEFFAERAAKGGRGRGMARTTAAAIIQNHGRRFGRFGAVKFRDADVDGGGFDEEFHVAKAELLAGGEPGIGHGLAVEKSSVGGMRVVQMHAVVGEGNLGVVRRDTGMRKVEFARRVAPDAVDAEAKFGGLLAEASGLDEEACHENF